MTTVDLDLLGRVGQLEFPDRVPYMDRALLATRQPWPALRLAGFRVLTGAAGPRAWAAYARGVRDSCASVRRAAADAAVAAAARNGDSEPDHRVVLALLAPDPHVRFQALTTLGECRGAGQLLVAMLGDPRSRGLAWTRLRAGVEPGALASLVGAAGAGQIHVDAARQLLLGFLEQREISWAIPELPLDPIRRRLVAGAAPPPGSALANLDVGQLGWDLLDDLIDLLPDRVWSDGGRASRPAPLLFPAELQAGSQEHRRLGGAALRALAAGRPPSTSLVAAAAQVVPTLLADAALPLPMRQEALGRLGRGTIDEGVCALLLASDLMRTRGARRKAILAARVLRLLARPWRGIGNLVPYSTILRLGVSDPAVVMDLYRPDEDSDQREVANAVKALIHHAPSHPSPPPVTAGLLLRLDPEQAGAWLGAMRPARAAAVLAHLASARDYPYFWSPFGHDWTGPFERALPHMGRVIGASLRRLSHLPEGEMTDVGIGFLTALFGGAASRMMQQGPARSALLALRPAQVASLLPVLRRLPEVPEAELEAAARLAGGLSEEGTDDSSAGTVLDPQGLENADDETFVRRFRRMRTREVPGLACTLMFRTPIDSLRLEACEALLLGAGPPDQVLAAMADWCRPDPGFQEALEKRVMPVLADRPAWSLPAAVWFADAPGGAEQLERYIVRNLEALDTLAKARINVLARCFAAIATVLDRLASRPEQFDFGIVNPMDRAAAALVSGTSAQDDEPWLRRLPLDGLSPHEVEAVKLAAARLLGAAVGFPQLSDRVDAAIAGIRPIVAELSGAVRAALPTAALAWPKEIPFQLDACRSGAADPEQLTLPGFEGDRAGAGQHPGSQDHAATLAAAGAVLARCVRAGRGRWRGTVGALPRLPDSVVAELVRASLVAGRGPGDARLLGGRWALEAIDRVSPGGRAPLLVRVVREGTDSWAVKEAAARLARTPAAASLVRRLGRILDWAQEFGRRHTGRTFAVRFAPQDQLGYTRPGADTIWVNPRPLLAGERQGDRIVAALCAHEIGHHLAFYDAAGEAAATLQSAADEGLGPLLNLVWDIALERRLRRLDRTLRASLDALAAYAFSREPWGIPVKQLVGVLGSRFFETASRIRLRPGPMPGTVVVRSGRLLSQLARSGSSFARFLRAARLGLGNRSADPKVAEGLALLPADLREARLPELLRIARALGEIFRAEPDLLRLRLPLWGSLSEAGITELEVPAGCRAINLAEQITFEPIRRVVAVGKLLPPDRPAAPVSIRVRTLLEKLGRAPELVGGRLAGHRIDRRALRTRIPLRDPRLAAAWSPSVTSSLCLGVLIDCSGSMEGPPFAWAVEFGRLLAQAAAGLPEIDARFWGFNHDTIYDAGTAESCGVTQLRVEGGNNDAAALRDAARQVQAGQRSLLIMVSDGSPTDCSVSALRALVGRLERDGHTCVHVALRNCPDSERCFQRTLSACELPPAEVLGRFGRLIEGWLEG